MRSSETQSPTATWWRKTISRNLTSCQLDQSSTSTRWKGKRKTFTITYHTAPHDHAKGITTTAISNIGSMVKKGNKKGSLIISSLLITRVEIHHTNVPSKAEKLTQITKVEQRRSPTMVISQNSDTEMLERALKKQLTLMMPILTECLKSLIDTI
jgi:hypothetical protein